MKLIAQAFETPVSEDATWLTNIIVSDDGTEQRISLLDMPVRSLQVTYNFATEDEARSLVRAFMMAQTGFQIPARQLSAPIAPAAAGAVALAFDPLRTELRDGAPAFVYSAQSGAGAVVTLGAIGAAGATLAAPLGAAIGPGWRICPLWAMFGSDNASISRARVNNIVTATASLRQLDFVDPFLNPRNTTVLPLFAGLPTIDAKAMGDEFGISYNSGATLIDYGAAVTIRSRWKHTQQQFARDFLCQRFTDRAGWYRWQAFLDYAKGSANPFYMPTMRPDFAIAAINANNVTLRGLDYATDYYPFSAFKQLSFYSSEGRHDVTVTNVDQVGGNSVCAFNPPLPNVAGLSAVSLLLKCRIADDRVSYKHDGIQTTLSLNMRTVDA